MYKYWSAQLIKVSEILSYIRYTHPQLPIIKTFFSLYILYLFLTDIQEGIRDNSEVSFLLQSLLILTFLCHSYYLSLCTSYSKMLNTFQFLLPTRNLNLSALLSIVSWSDPCSSLLRVIKKHSEFPSHTGLFSTFLPWHILFPLSRMSSPQLIQWENH